MGDTRSQARNANGGGGSTEPETKVRAGHASRRRPRLHKATGLLALLLPALHVVVACGQALEPPTAPVSAAQAETVTADVVLTTDQNLQTVTVSVGQVIQVKIPTHGSEWAADYAFDILEALTPPDKMADPGPDGWLFRAKAAGETDLAFRMIPSGGGSPPNPMRIVFTIRVTA